MANILTPVSIWTKFDASLPLEPELISMKEENGVKFEYYYFSGRKTNSGRVRIYGVFASSVKSSSSDAILIVPDGNKSVDEKLLKYYVEKGYCALMIDYRGQYKEAINYTRYPADISYANFTGSNAYKGPIIESAVKTAWYEWVGVAIYARKFLVERVDSDSICAVGIKDGGEIVWKLAYATQLKCAVVVNSSGWLAYRGINKFGSGEVKIEQEKYCFLAGVDSQAYAPLVRCPIMIMCSANDETFDYDRAYDTFSRINPNYIDDSVITYSFNINGCIDLANVQNMIMFLNKHVKNRQVFIPQPAEITIKVDEEYNLIANACFDEEGEVEEVGLYFAEDVTDCFLRVWTKEKKFTKVSSYEYEFPLNVYERCRLVFAVSYVKYTNGFTAWSKMAIKKIGGTFKNTVSKCKVLYDSKNGNDSFTFANKDVALSKIFLMQSDEGMCVVETKKDIKGLYCEGGLLTYRLNDPKYAPEVDSVLKIDVYSFERTYVHFVVFDLEENVEYKYSFYSVDGVWQNVVMESNKFKSANGMTLSTFKKKLLFAIDCDSRYAVNNFMWL